MQIDKVTALHANIRLILKITLFLTYVFWGQVTMAATLGLSPDTGVYSAGQTFPVRVIVNTAGTPINAAEGVLSFNPNELSVVSVAKGSIFNLWTSEPSFSNSAGTINFSGGTPTGFTGGAGTILTVTFRTKSAGSPKVSFKNGSVLAADGKGTNVLTGMGGGTYTIAAVSTTPEAETIVEYVPPANTPGMPNITSVTHPDQTLWYQEKTAKLSWVLPSGVVAIRTLLDDRTNSVPTKVYDTPIDSITLDDLQDGEQYFHLQFKNADGWGKVAHYRLAVDTMPPQDFSVSLAENADLSNAKQILSVAVSDNAQGSPLTSFTAQIDGQEPVEILYMASSSTLELPDLEPGYHTVVVEAKDAAQNSAVASVSFTIMAFDKPTFAYTPSQISTGVVPVFEGKTRPHSTVLVTLTKIGTNPIETTTVSDESGSFRYIPDSPLVEGVYELTARAVDQQGAQSDISDTIRFVVSTPGFLRVGSFMVSVLSVVVPLIALTILLIIVIIFGWKRMGAFRSGVSREAKEAAAILNREFQVLDQVILEHANSLQETRKTGKLTKAEELLIEDLKKNLEEARDRVSKEISDVTNMTV